jgi:hypothetical protein
MADKVLTGKVPNLNLSQLIEVNGIVESKDPEPSPLFDSMPRIA